ncbi:P1 family peptidase [Puniceicoccaceae bacterium K14]|nr:P1 family peptidase [Puniceicoccaceae bacterium K14]
MNRDWARLPTVASFNQRFSNLAYAGEAGDYMSVSFRNATLLLFVCAVALTLQAQRARDLGIPFRGEPGPLNAITDVEGVAVGHATLIEGEGSLIVGEGPVRTGVTAILPQGLEYGPFFAAWASLNGNGELTGTHWIEESGFLEEPILLTNTHSVGAVADASIKWRRARNYHDGEPGTHGWAALPVVGETWDGRLNDIHGGHVSEADVFAALDSAKGGPVKEGNVGGGTGMVCHRFKGGIGTSSRVTENGYTVGVLVQANYGLREDLIIAGHPVGLEITDLMPEMSGLEPAQEGNSIMVIIATDAPLLSHQLKRLANRATVGLARVGGYGANSSGDLFLAFSTHRPVSAEDGTLSTSFLPNGSVTELFRAVAHATEEAIINALVAAETMTGINGNTIHALPHESIKSVFAR